MDQVPIQPKRRAGKTCNQVRSAIGNKSSLVGNKAKSPMEPLLSLTKTIA